jgi:hypothetical protein
VTCNSGIAGDSHQSQCPLIGPPPNGPSGRQFPVTSMKGVISGAIPVSPGRRPARLENRKMELRSVESFQTGHVVD